MFCNNCGNNNLNEAAFCTSCGESLIVKNSTENQSEPIVDWHYTINGSRFGPVSEDQIIKLIKEKKITKQSLVWNKNMPDWYPIEKSKLDYLVKDLSAPPPLTGTAVKNNVIWVLAFAPIIGSFSQSLLSFLTGISIETFWFVTLILNVLLCSLDEKKLKAAGHDTSEMGFFWLVPVYLFKRAKVLNQNFAYFIVWCVCFGLFLLF